MSFSEKLYRLLLLAYPASLRNEHGVEMLQLFRDLLRDAKASGRTSYFWLRTLWDWSRTVVYEQLSRRTARAHKPRPPLPMRILVIRSFSYAPVPIAALIVIGVAAYRRFSSSQRRFRP